MLTILPVSYEALPHLHDTPDLDDGDEACLSQIREVLERHGKLSRFAIHLAHKHFDLAPDEVPIEYPNEKARTQRVVVGKLAPGMRQTTWLFDGLHADSGPYCVCVSDPVYAAGCFKHDHSNSPGEAAKHEEAVKNRRIGEEKAKYDRGFPSGGHEWDRER
jgi:hypothetical protein